jgi:hypothetical protein
MHAAIEELYFLCGLCQEVITGAVGAMSQLSSARELRRYGAVVQLTVQLWSINQQVMV